jgi:hypothetical protein
MSPHHADRLSRHYEQEAETTRRSLARSLNELNEQLTPGRIVDEVLTYGRDGGGVFVRSFSNAMRDNPMPALLIGAGVMMFLSEKIGIMRPGNGRYAARRSYESEEETGQGIAADAKEKVSRATEGVKETVKEGLAAVGDTIADASQRARSATHDMRQSLGETAGEVKRRTQNVGRRVAESATHTGEQAIAAGRQVKDKAATLMNEQPLVMAGIGLALGAAIAALLPSTKMEDELMGETSDNVKRKIGDAAAHQFETAKETAKDLAEQAKNLAEREGLTTAGAAAEVVRRFGSTGSDESSLGENRMPPERQASLDEQPFRKT